MDTRAWEGGCLCGVLRYRSQAQPLWVAHCHCGSCRRHSGGALTTFAGFDAGRFQWLGETGRYHSSAGVTRRFCAHCGTPLSYESERHPGEVHVLIGTLDEPARAVPEAHVFVAERLPWLRLHDDLPRYAGSSAAGEPPVGTRDD